MLHEDSSAKTSARNHSGARELRHKTRIRSWFKIPLSYNLTTGIWRPSSQIVRASMDRLPAVLPWTSLMFQEQIGMGQRSIGSREAGSLGAG